MLSYAGIGSRKTPEDVLCVMTKMARHLESFGWRLRSGGAEGADGAFSKGAKEKTIYRPWPVKREPDAYVIPDRTLDELEVIAREFHPNWKACTKWAKKLHARNVAIVLGEHADHPVDMVIAWTSNGNFEGGTATALRMAKANNIPVMNLGAMDRTGTVRSLKNESMDGNPHAARIDRKTVFGNPFHVGDGQTRERAIQRYCERMAENLEKDAGKWMPLLASLKGRDLYCNCSPKACHGDVLIEGSEMAWKSLLKAINA